MNAETTPHHLYVDPSVLEFKGPFSDRQTQKLKLLNGSTVWMAVMVSTAKHKVITFDSPLYVRMAPGELLEVEVLCNPFDVQKPPTYLKWPVLISSTPMNDLDVPVQKVLHESSTKHNMIVPVVINMDTQRTVEPPSPISLHAVSTGNDAADMLRRVLDLGQENLFKAKKAKDSRIEDRQSGDQAESDFFTKKGGPVDEVDRKDISIDLSVRSNQSQMREARKQLKGTEWSSTESTHDSSHVAESAELSLSSTESTESESTNYAASGTENTMDVIEPLHSLCYPTSDSRSVVSKETVEKGKSRDIEGVHSDADDQQSTATLNRPVSSISHTQVYPSMKDVPRLIPTVIMPSKDEPPKEFIALAYSSAGQTSYIMAHELDRVHADYKMYAPKQQSSLKELATPDSAWLEMETASPVSCISVATLDTLLPLPELELQENKMLWTGQKMSCSTANSWSTMDSVRTAKLKSDDTAEQAESTDNDGGSPHVSH